MNRMRPIKMTRRGIQGSTLALAVLAAGWAGTATGGITWNLASGGDWDTSTANWTGDSTFFTDNGTVNVIFNKTGGGTITIASDMSPLSTTVSAASGTYIFSGGPIDSGTLAKSGAGILTLSGANSFSGVTLSAGQLNINNAGALGTGTFTINGGIIDNTSGSAKTLSTVTPIALNATFTFNGSRALNLGTGSVTLGATVAVTGSGTLGTATPLTIGGNIAGGANGLQVIKSAFVILSGANSYSGATAFKNFGNQLNMIRADDGVGLPIASTLAIETAGVFETGKDLVRVGGTGAGQMAIGSNVKNNLGFSAYGGPIKVCFGTLASPTALTWGNAPFNTGSYALILNYTTANNTLDFRNPVNLNAAVRTVEVGANVATMSGILSGTGSSGLTKTGAGTLVLLGDNTYPGATRVSGGKLNAGVASVAGVSGALGLNSSVTLDNVAGVSLDLNGFDTVIGALAGGGALGGNVTLGTNTLTVGTQNTSTTFDGIISGSNTCSLVKTGTGTNTLNGVNTYTGDTTVSGGVLVLGNTSAMGSTKTLALAATGASVSLPSGTTTINALYIDGKQQAKGTWGSSTSGASHTSDTYFSGGSGNVLDVKTGPLLGTMIRFF